MALPLLRASLGSNGAAALRGVYLRPALRTARVPFRCMAAKGGKGKEKEESKWLPPAASSLARLAARTLHWLEPCSRLLRMDVELHLSS